MDRIAALAHARTAVDAHTANSTAVYGALLLAIDTATAAADIDPDRADRWDFCTIDLRAAAAQLQPQFGLSTALNPALPALTQVNDPLAAALRNLLTSTAGCCRRIATTAATDDTSVSVAMLLDQAAAAVP
ncbi:hypothetical protein [Dactylosporangium sp. CA-233914]|uniref:hypothetical protein n=1 Tax=Dactylosporangium sp. CA-233914 TaxID=3239934 RepID=UPI003D90FC78